MSKKRLLWRIALPLIALIAAACLLLTASSLGLLPFDAPSWQTLFGKENSAVITAQNDRSAVHFIDCGQGDCEAIVSGETLTVIDSGPGKNAERTYEYIKSLGFDKIDHLVLTHPHEDHIGGAKKLIERFEIGNIYMPRPKEGSEPTTAVYRNLLRAIAEKGLSITTAKAGVSFEAGGFLMEMISPSKEYDEANDQSVVIHAVCGNVSFLFTGDAEKEPMNAMMKQYPDRLASTVLKVGHHGSRTSTNDKWLKAVSPSYAVISCEDGNSYGHPHGSVLKSLEKCGAEIYRTDLHGSVVMITNGQSISVTIEKAEG